MTGEALQNLIRTYIKATNRGMTEQTSQLANTILAARLEVFELVDGLLTQKMYEEKSLKDV